LEGLESLERLKDLETSEELETFVPAAALASLERHRILSGGPTVEIHAEPKGGRWRLSDLRDGASAEASAHERLELAASREEVRLGIFAWLSALPDGLADVAEASALRIVLSSKGMGGGPWRQDSGLSPPGFALTCPTWTHTWAHSGDGPGRTGAGEALRRIAALGPAKIEAGPEWGVRVEMDGRRRADWWVSAADPRGAAMNALLRTRVVLRVENPTRALGRLEVLRVHPASDVLDAADRAFLASFGKNPAEAEAP